MKFSMNKSAEQSRASYSSVLLSLLCLTALFVLCFAAFFACGGSDSDTDTSAPTLDYIEITAADITGSIKIDAPALEETPLLPGGAPFGALDAVKLKLKAKSAQTVISKKSGDFNIAGTGEAEAAGLDVTRDAAKTVVVTLTENGKTTDYTINLVRPAVTPVVQGGAITYIESAGLAFEIHTFTCPSATVYPYSATYTFEIAKAGYSKPASLLIVAGGGGGGGGTGTDGGGGGGAGGFIYKENFTLTTGSYEIWVGTGGTGGTGWTGSVPSTTGLKGIDSKFGNNATEKAVGGGGGGKGGYFALDSAGQPGGSGGGGGAGSGDAQGNAGAVEITGQGNIGGKGGKGTGGGGGGGAGSVGINGSTDNSSTAGTDGGTGKSCDITGTATAYSAGGQGGSKTVDGTIPAYAGSGGGGGYLAGSNGQNGIVIVRLPWSN